MSWPNNMESDNSKDRDYSVKCMKRVHIIKVSENLIDELQQMINDFVKGLSLNGLVDIKIIPGQFSITAMIIYLDDSIENTH